MPPPLKQAHARPCFLPSIGIQSLILTKVPMHVHGVAYLRLYRTLVIFQVLQMDGVEEDLQGTYR